MNTIGTYMNGIIYANIDFPKSPLSKKLAITIKLAIIKGMIAKLYEITKVFSVIVFGLFL